MAGGRVIEWPIVIDAVERDRLADAVAARRARVQLIRGPSGIGKSTLAASVASSLEQAGYSILRIVGMPELRDVPLGAMAPLLASTGAPADESTSDRLHRLFTLAAPATTRQVLLVDDGPMLDEVSASTVYQLVRVYGLACVMTARTEHPLDGALLRLQQEDALDTTELRGLPAAVASDAARQALGGSVETESLRAIVDLAAGNPLFLRELVLAATQGDALRPGSSGVVVDAASLPAHLRDTIALRFRGLSAEERGLAELIATAEPWPPELLSQPQLLAALDREGLVARAPDGEVYLSHPLFAETLIGGLSPERRDALRTQAAERLIGGSREDHRFKAICLLAETPSPPSPDDLTWAATYAHRVDDQTLAARLARQAIARSESLDRPAPFEARLVLADALAVSSQFVEADAAFEVAATAAETDIDIANLVTRRGFYLAVRRQRPRDAVQLGTAAVQAMAPSASRDYLAGNLAKWQLMLGQAPELSTEAEEPLTAFNNELFRMMAGVLGGDLVGTRAAIEFARPRAEAAKALVRHATDMIDFADFFVIALDGRIDDAVVYARDKRGEVFDESVGMWNFGLALVALHQGYVESALESATSAVEQLTWRDFLGARGAAIALKATAAEHLGRHPEALEALALLDPDARAYVVTDLQASESEAWALALSGREDEALALVHDAVERGIDGNCFLLATFTAYVAVRLGKPGAELEHLRTIGRSTSGELIAAMVGHAEALASGEPEKLLEAGRRLAVSGLLAGAVDAARQAAELAAITGHDRLARRATLQVSQWQRGLSRSATTPPDDAALSEREWLVATAAAGRARSKEIAEQLGLSVRTVDNHLARIYRKLGVTGRDGLRDELDVLSSRD